MRNRIPIFITIAAGVFMILKFFLTIEWVKRIADEIEQWCLIVFAGAVVLGVANVLRVNFHAVRRKSQDWGYKIVLIAAMLIATSAGITDLAVRGNIAAGGAFQFLFDSVFAPLDATMFSLLAFYIASAAFRAFRARNARAAILLASGTLVMIGRVPIGETISPYLPRIAGWLMAYPNAAGQRGLIIGAAMGVIATGLRVIFGIERPYLRGE